MKGTATALAAMAAVSIAVSCGKDTGYDAGSFEPAVINAVCEGIGTKVDMAYRYDQVWQDGDRILVTDGRSSDSFTLSDGAGTTEGRFVQDNKVSFGGEVEAFFPSALISGSSRVWPAVQTDGDVIPMYSKGTLEGEGPADFRFSSLGASLRLAVNTPEKGIVLKSIVISDDDKPLSGRFTVSGDGMAVISSENGGGITFTPRDEVPLGLAPKYFDIAVPAGNYSKLRILLKASDGSAFLLKDEHLNIAGNTAEVLFVVADRFRPAGAILTGEFTVNDEGRTVVFSKGNLWYNAGDCTFHFENGQTDRPSGIYDSRHVGNFFWNTDYARAAQESSPELDGAGTEDVLFTNLSFETPDPGFTVDGVTGRYRTLSSAEWAYLTGSAPKRAGKFRSMIYFYNGQHYMGLAPDGYPGNIPGRIDSEEEFMRAEDMGVVFFPYAGYRHNGSIYYANGGPTGGECHYWLSDPDAGNAILAHTSDGPTKSRSALAFSLRLVAE